MFSVKQQVLGAGAFLINRKITFPMSHLHTPWQHLHFRQKEFYLSRKSPCIGGELRFVAV